MKKSDILINHILQKKLFKKESKDSWMRNSRARKEILFSLFNNNTSFALLNAWSELENDVKFHTNIRYKKFNSGIIVEQCVDNLKLSKIEKRRLVSISQMRNGIAHAIPNRSKPSWSDVSFILRLAKKYRRMKK
tara:strand:+ start:804 stop:1205 length:402 start_codon:yes stop_codon:yes gene_type:complete